MDVRAMQSVGIRYCIIVFPMVGLGSMLVMYDSVNGGLSSYAHGYAIKCGNTHSLE